MKIRHRIRLFRIRNLWATEEEMKWLYWYELEESMRFSKEYFYFDKPKRKVTRQQLIRWLWIVTIAGLFLGLIILGGKQ